jgi:hypothetical protein
MRRIQGTTLEAPLVSAVYRGRRWSQIRCTLVLVLLIWGSFNRHRPYSYGDSGRRIVLSSVCLVNATWVGFKFKAPEWKKRVIAFWGEAADESSVIAAYQGYLEQWSDESSVFDLKSVDTLFKDIVSWTPKLRTGGCSALVDAVLARLRMWWQQPEHRVDDELMKVTVAYLIKHSGDPLVKDIQTALHKKTAEQARDTALAEFTEIVGSFRGEPEKMEAFLVAATKVAKLPKADSVLNDMHNARGFLCKAFAESWASYERRTDATSTLLSVATKLLTTLTAELTSAEYTSTLSTDFIKGFELALDLKTVICDLRADLADSGTGDGFFKGFFEKMRSWAEFADSHANNFYLKMISDSFAPDAVAAKQEFATASEAALRRLLEEVAKKKGRLDKVAGGLSASGSWKSGLPDDIQLHDPRMEKACAVVATAYCQAMEARTVELKKVPMGFKRQ